MVSGRVVATVEVVVQVVSEMAGVMVRVVTGGQVAAMVGGGIKVVVGVVVGGGHNGD